MNKNNKFLFNLHNFDAPGQAVEKVVEEDVYVEPPPPSFSQEDIDIAKATAQANGFSEGLREERISREQKISDLLRDIADNFSSLFAAEKYRERQYEEEAVKLSYEVLNIAVPALSSLVGKETLESVIRENLKKQSEQSEIIIELNPDDTADIEKILSSLWKDPENAPRCKIIANEAIEAGACSLSWADGGLIRDPKKTAQDIKTSLEQILKGQEAPKRATPLTKSENNAINKGEDSAFEENGELNE